jgi:hypothetical protein
MDIEWFHELRFGLFSSRWNTSLGLGSMMTPAIDRENCFRPPFQPLKAPSFANFPTSIRWLRHPFSQTIVHRLGFAYNQPQNVESFYDRNQAEVSADPKSVLRVSWLIADVQRVKTGVEGETQP